MTRMDTGLGGEIVSGVRPRPRGFARPEQLELGLDTLPGVSATFAKKLRPLGLATVGDLLLRRPRRYETAADEVAISELWGDEETVIAGVVRSARSRRLGGRRSMVTAQVADASGSISASWFNQPWILDRLKPGTAVRLRGKLGRYGFDVKSYDVGETRATADFAPVYGASEAVPSWRLRELTRAALTEHAATSSTRCRPSSSCRCAATRCACCTSRGRRGGRGRAEAARARGAARAAARGAALARRGRGGDAARLARRAGRALPRGAAVRADRAPGARDRGHRRRPGARGADAAAAAGRRRVGQDGRRAVRAAARGRVGPAGRVHGSDGNARRAALPHDRDAVLGARRARRAADRHLRLEARARGDRERRRADRGRHARPDPGRRRVRRPRRRGRRRAAPLRRRAAPGARGAARAARPAHDGDADPAHARADRLRRPRRDRDREAAGQPAADRDRVGRRGALVGRVRAAVRAPRRGPAGVRRVPADRGVGDALGARGGGRGRAAPARGARGLPRRPACTAASRPPTAAR